MVQSALAEAKPIARILDCNSGHTAGWLYRWNTEDFAMIWIIQPHPDCELAPRASNDPELSNALNQILSKIAVS